MRLTEKTKYGYSTNGKISSGIVYIDDKNFTNSAIYKLGQLEDIEDELGIDLITLFKVLTSDVYLYHNDRLTKCEQAPSLLNFDGEYCLEYHFENDIEQVYLKDYGKTWVLTKEELENKQ